MATGVWPMRKGTALRELDQLYEWGMLQRLGKGRSVHYELAHD